MRAWFAGVLCLLLVGPIRAELRTDFDAQLDSIEHGSDQRRLGEAEAALQRLRLDPSAQTPARLARIELEAARVELRRGQFLLAEHHMLDWMQTYGAQVSERERVRAAIVLAQSRFEQNQLGQAAAELRTLLTSNAAADGPDLRAEIYNALGAVQIYAGQTELALHTLNTALRDALPAEQPLLRSQILCWMGLAHWFRGELAAAQASFQAGLELRQKHAPDSVSEAVAAYFLGIVARRQGEALRPRAYLDRALQLLDAERVRQSAYADTRAQWAAQFAFIYRGAIIDAVNSAELPRAFALLQRYRGPEHALQQPMDPSALLRDGQARLAPGESVLAFVTHYNQNLALVLTADTLQSFPIALDEAGLREAVDAFAMLIAARSAADPRALQERSHQLYQLLIAPALLLAPATKRLLLQPDGQLHELPFAALVSAPRPSPRYLVEDLVLSHLGSLEQRPAAVSGSAAARPLWTIADPELSGSEAFSGLRDGSDRRLPGANIEARAIHRLYAPGATLLLADAATEAAVKAAPRDVDLHFATHMVRDSIDEQHSFLALRAGAGEDGQLSAAEIFASLRGPRELVVLSGCASQRGALAGGAGALSLARAWQQAGARRVLATQWPVPDRATSQVMVLFHSKRRSGADVALGLAQAQREWLSNTRAPGLTTQIERWWRREQSTELALPFYWAAMVASE